MRKSRGFFFVLISFILILYIFVYLTAWINASEIAEKSSSEKFRAAGIDGIVYELNEQKFSDFFKGAGYYALFSINNYSSDSAHTLKYDKGSSDELVYLRSAFLSLVEHGNSSSSNFDGAPLAYSSSEADTYTFDAWLRNLNATLAPAGLRVTKFQLSNEQFYNGDTPVTFVGAVTLDLTVEDSLSTISITRNFTLRQTFNISGFPDPMIKRESEKLPLTETVERQIYYNPDYEPSDLKPILVDNETAGQGFFYGPLIDVDSVTPTHPFAGLRGTYILVGNYSDIYNLQGHQEFGAYIVTNDPTYSSSDDCSEKNELNTFIPLNWSKSGGHCIATCAVSDPDVCAPDKPFAVIKDFHMNDYSEYNGSRMALLIANHTVSEVQGTPELKNQLVEVYDIENLRDAAMCTYYIHTGRAPSYPQRLSKDALSLSSTDYGIETFLVGTWAGGEDLPLTLYQEYSRVDWEFFKKVDGEKIRGMPGCKNPNMCAAPVGSNAPLGHFALSPESIDLYEVQGIACEHGKARCDEP
ncbi:MAG: hypothetical protein PHS02_00020 [Candidatus ainarchaeum sp.]|nr:hypothetical protein [Candidatus ainarchaeum sp.]